MTNCSRFLVSADCAGTMETYSMIENHQGGGAIWRGTMGGCSEAFQTFQKVFITVCMANVIVGELLPPFLNEMNRYMFECNVI